MEMKLNKRANAVLAILAIAGAMLLVGSDEALASNMGFKENKQIFAQDGPPQNGRNLVALPFNNPYVTSQDVCDALNLAGASCRVSQVNASTGAQPADFCAAAGGAFNITARVGVLIDSCTANTSGILVGSHAPAVPVNLFQQTPPSPKGFNHYPVPFHTTNANMQAVCVDIGVPAGPGRILRNNADTGVQTAWNCGPGVSPNLVLGESVIIDSLTAPLNPVPSHF
jgi:hypothetical protein